MQLCIYNYMCISTLYICVHTCTHTHTTLEESVPFCEHLGKHLAALIILPLTWVYSIIHALSFNSLRQISQSGILNYMAILYLFFEMQI